MASPEITAALGKQTTFNTALVAKLTEIGTALNSRAKTSDLIDGNGKLKTELLPFALADLLTIKGPADLVTNPALIQSGAGKEGDIWLVTVAASGLNIDGITEVKVGDWLMFIDGAWQHLPFGGAGAGAGLLSFNGRTAANVVPQAGDYSAALIGVVALQHLTGSNVQEVLVAVDGQLQVLSDDLAAVTAKVDDLSAAFVTLGNNFDSAATAIGAIVIA